MEFFIGYLSCQVCRRMRGRLNRYEHRDANTHRDDPAYVCTSGRDGVNSFRAYRDWICPAFRQQGPVSALAGSLQPEKGAAVRGM
ncbi:MAG: hypothetical protein AAFN05_12320, partial [Pseudomonadota bacterium]